MPKRPCLGMAAGRCPGPGRPGLEQDPPPPLVHSPLGIVHRPAGGKRVAEPPGWRRALYRGRASPGGDPLTSGRDAAGGSPREEPPPPGPCCAAALSVVLKGAGWAGAQGTFARRAWLVHWGRRGGGADERATEPWALAWGTCGRAPAHSQSSIKTAWASAEIIRGRGHSVGSFQT